MKCSLRELFLLVVIAAMGCAWWVERRKSADLELPLTMETSAVEKRRALLDAFETEAYRWRLTVGIHSQTGEQKVIVQLFRPDGSSVTYPKDADLFDTPTQ
jgi:hypothetical protein